MKALRIWTMALLICLGMILITGANEVRGETWQEALASGIDSSNLTTAHFHEIGKSRATIIAAGRAMERQKVGRDIDAWAAYIVQIQLSGPVPQWVFDKQRETVDLYEVLRPLN